MSILLDSLRKSEAQRNVGEAPTIYSTQDYGGSGHSDKRWVGWLLMALAALAITWYGWQQYSFPGSGEGQMQAPAQQEAESETAVARSATQAAQDSGTAQVARTPVEQISRTSDASDTPGEELAGEDRDSPLDRIAAFEASEESMAQAQAESQPGAQDSLSNEESESPVAEDPEERVFAEEDPWLERARARRSPGAEPAQDQPMSYWQLPQGLRNELPEFRITVLVYAEQPEDRFLLMDGERLVEQDEMDGGVTLEEIRRDGAVFTYESWRFLVRN